jgi:hypothetical protein
LKGDVGGFKTLTTFSPLLLGEFCGLFMTAAGVGDILTDGDPEIVELRARPGCVDAGTFTFENSLLGFAPEKCRFSKKYGDRDCSEKQQRTSSSRSIDSFNPDSHLVQCLST